MNVEQKIDNQFKKIRDFKVEKCEAYITDAAADIQEYMAQVCVGTYNYKTEEMEEMSNSMILKMLRLYMKQTKASYKKYWLEEK